METTQKPLAGKSILVTGSAYRLGKVMALTAARLGAEVIIHHGHSQADAESTAAEAESLGVRARIVQADLSQPAEVERLIAAVFTETPLYGLINNAAIFPPGGLLETDLTTWQQNLAVNLTAPFLLSQAFIRLHAAGEPGRVINMLDWRALRPGRDHFGYTISKAGLAALTQACAVAGAPQVTVNAIALGAILPPSDGGESEAILRNVPARRWASIDELEDLCRFLLTGPEYITGEIIHLDGGRHLI
jgi:NAD(P)-dependent dehydrogenase (short-subunit alcohol dehydrogenase family)